MAKRVSGLGQDRADLIAQMTGKASASGIAVSNGNNGIEEPRRSMLQTLKAGAEQMRRIPVEDVAPHPDNPRQSLGNVADLGKSIRDNGQYQPILVTPVDEFVVHYPEHREAVEGKAWVVYAGNRRLAAHVLEGLETILAIPRPIKEKLDSYITFVEENLKREGFSPIEEALAFEQVRDAGNLTQRQTAERLNVSASHVNKRLQLLTLPQTLQDAIVDGSLAPSDALNISGKPHAEQVRVWEFAQRNNCLIATAVVRVAEAEAREESKAANTAAAKKAGAQLIEDPRTEWAKPSEHVLYGEREIRAAAKAKTLKAHVTDKGLVYYAGVPNAERTGATAAEQAAAAKARSQVAGHWVRGEKDISPEVLLPALTHLALSGGPNPAAVKLALEWLGEEINSTPPAGDGKAWLDWLNRRLDGPGVSIGNKAPSAGDRQRAAWALKVATDEIAARSTAAWDERTASYLTELINRQGYQPAPWEAALVAALTEEN